VCVNGNEGNVIMAACGELSLTSSTFNSGAGSDRVICGGRGDAMKVAKHVASAFDLPWNCLGPWHRKTTMC